MLSLEQDFNNFLVTKIPLVVLADEQHPRLCVFTQAGRLSIQGYCPLKIVNQTVDEGIVGFVDGQLGHFWVFTQEFRVNFARISLESVVERQVATVFLDNIPVHILDLFGEAAEARGDCVVLHEPQAVGWLVYHVVGAQNEALDVLDGLSPRFLFVKSFADVDQPRHEGILGREVGKKIMDVLTWVPDDTAD